MYIMNGVAHAGEASQYLAVEKVKVLDDMYMLVQFSSGEQRILDANVLLEYPVYRKLLEPDVFATATVEDGILVWLDGDIDIGTMKLYSKSVPYNVEIA